MKMSGSLLCLNRYSGQISFSLLLLMGLIPNITAWSVQVDTALIRKLVTEGKQLLATDEQTAQRRFLHAYRIADSVKYLDDLVVYAMTELATYATYHGKLDSATSLSIAALKYYSAKQDTVEMAKLQSRIGDILRANGMYGVSYGYFNSARALALAVRDSTLLALVYNRIAACFYEDEQMPQDSADKYATLSLEISRKLNQPKRIFNNLNILGSIASRQNNYQKALTLYNEALVILLVVAPQEQPLILSNMAYNYRMLGDFDKAEELSLRAYELAEKYEIPQYIFMASLNLEQVYRLKGDYKRAHHFLRICTQIESQMVNQRVMVQLQDFNYRSEMEKQANENRRLEYERQITRNRMYALLFLSALLFFMLVVVGFFLYYQSRQRKKINEINEKLNQSNMVLHRFISILAHDLRSPFNAILGFTDMLYEDIDRLESEHRVAVESLRHSGRSTYALLERLLEWSRLQSGSITANKSSFLLNKEVEEILTLLSPAAAAKQISLAFNPGDQVTLLADPEMISTVIRNLVSNAVKFTPSGGSVTVSAGKEGGFAILTVSDTGVGISPKDTVRLFRLEENYKSKGTAGETGTGLGLILCRDYVVLHGGTIRVDSEPGTGTTFIVKLPLQEERSASSDRTTLNQ